MRALFRLIVFGFVVMWIDEASATDTVLGKCTQISFTAKRADYPTATVSAALDERSDRLASLEVRLAGKPIELPRKAFADLPSAQMRTI